MGCAQDYKVQLCFYVSQQFWSIFWEYSVGVKRYNTYYNKNIYIYIYIYNFMSKCLKK